MQKDFTTLLTEFQQYWDETVNGISKNQRLLKPLAQEIVALKDSKAFTVTALSKSEYYTYTHAQFLANYNS